MKRLLNPITPIVVAAMVFYATLMLAHGEAHADGIDDGLADIQHGWAKAYYQVPDKQKESAFKELAARAHQFTVANPSRAEPMVWEAIVLSSYAKFAGGLGALDKAKMAKELLLKAEKVQPDVLEGSVYTSLGSLYYKVPGWPIGFGDKKKSREYLEKAVKLNPTGIDANYFYGDYLLEQGEYAKAREYLEKAMAAPARPGREDADQGRHQEVQQALEKLRSKT